MIFFFQQNIGSFLLEVVATDSQLRVVAEGLDGIFDVFGDDRTNVVLQELGMIEKLEQVAPVLKQKVERSLLCSVHANGRQMPTSIR